MTDSTSSEPMPEIDSSVPHTARVWNYWLGGKDNYPVDRDLGEKIKEIYPGITDYALHDRYFLGRCVRYLAGEAGVRQFLDIGTGLPTVDNTHEVAQRVAPESRVVYVDNDPLVLVHARALLTSSTEGATDYIHADLRDPAAILSQSARTLDLSQPVALMLLGILNFIRDDDEADAIVQGLMRELAPGSYMVVSHPTEIVDGDGMRAAVENWNAAGEPKLKTRTPEQVARLYEGLELLDPGVVVCTRWRPDAIDVDGTIDVPMLGAVGRKP